MTYFDLCPICGVMREMVVTGYRTMFVDVRGESSTVLTRVYHCSVCDSFARAEDVADTVGNSAGVLLDDEQPFEGKLTDVNFTN